MSKYIRHILIALTAFLAIIIVNFALPRMLPGDPVFLLTGFDAEVLSRELYYSYYTALGLDKPLAEQFGDYLADVFGGGLGFSYRHNADVASLIADSLPATLQIVLPAIVISTLLAMWTGLTAARRPRGIADTAMTASAALLGAVPTFLAGMIMVVFFSFTLGWLPYGNLNSPGVDPGTIEGFFDRIAHLILPIATLTLATTPSKYMMIRYNAEKASEEKYVLYARSKGVDGNRLSFRHIFPNVGQPFLAMTGLNLGAMLGGSVVVETIFSVNGMGMLVSQAVGENGEIFLCGMSVLDKEQHLDTHTLIQHHVPHCKSNELFKYVLNDRAIGAFSGRIWVKEGADKTEAYQTNRNLCATRETRMYSKPQLEIYADDVKCSHGMTTGQLDENAMFYMRSRGIPPEEARMLLSVAFTSDVIEHIRIPALKDRLHNLVEKRFRGELAKCEGCRICK